MELPNQLDFLETKTSTSISTNNALSQKTNIFQNAGEPEASFKDALNASLIQNKEMPFQNKEIDKINLLNQAQLFDLPVEEVDFTDLPKKMKRDGLNKNEFNQSDSDEAPSNQISTFNFMDMASHIKSKLPIESAFNAASELKTQMESEIKKTNLNIVSDKQVNILADLKLTDSDQKAHSQNHPSLEVPLFDMKADLKNQEIHQEFNLKKSDSDFSFNDKGKIFSEVSNVTNSILQQTFQKLNLSMPDVSSTHEILTKDKVPFSPMTEAQTLVTSIQEGDSVLHTAFLKIYPPELGPVIAKIKMNSNNEAELSLLTSNAQTRDVLVANIQNIKENFSESDMMLHKVHVEYHSDLLQQGSTSNSKDEQRERFFQAKFDPNLFEDSAKKAKIKSTSNTSVIDAYI